MPEVPGPVFPDEPFPSESNTSRPDASLVTPGTAIWNTDDNAPNWSDGTYWRDADGNIT